MMVQKEKRLFTVDGLTYVSSEDYKTLLRLMNHAYFDISYVGKMEDTVVTLPKGQMKTENGIIQNNLKLDEELPILYHLGVKEQVIRKKGMVYGQPNKAIIVTNSLLRERYAYLSSYLKKQALPYRLKLNTANKIILARVEEGKEVPIALKEITDSHVENLIVSFFHIAQFKWDGLVLFLDKPIEEDYSLLTDFLYSVYRIPVIIG